MYIVQSRKEDIVTFIATVNDLSPQYLISKWLDIDGPLMGVSILFTLLSEVQRYISINYWLDNCHTLFEEKKQTNKDNRYYICNKYKNAI